MNERNVDALATLFERDGIPLPHARALARALAARGVLVPTALTDEETQVLRTFGCTLNGKIYEPGTPQVVRFALELIASGESVPWVGETYSVNLNSEPAENQK